MARGVKGAWCLLLTLTLSFGLSLEEAQRKALESFYEVEIQRLDMSKRREERLERLGRLMPSLDLELSFNISKKQSFTFSIPPAPPQEFVFQKESYPTFTLKLDQSLFNLPDIRSYEIAKEIERSQMHLLREKKNEVLYRVREAYINALKARSVLEIYQKHLQRVEAHLKDVERLYEEGLVAYKDVLQTKVKLFEVKEKLASAQASYRKAMNFLSYLVGEEVGEVLPIDTSKYMLPTDYGELLKRLEERPALRYALENVRISKKGVELASSYFYPQVVFSAIYQRTEESDLFPKDRYFVSFAFRWNLFSGLRRLRSLEIARLSHREARKRYEDLRERLRLELKNTLEEIRAEQAKIDYARRQLEDAKEHLRVALEKYRAGLGTNTEVLDAQSYFKTAEETLEMSKYDLLLKIFKLREVLGDE